MNVFVFDLDDTLYEELTYVRSGFHAVARFLQAEKSIPMEDTLALMMEELRVNGRGKVFDQVLEHYGILSKLLVRRCLQVYRSHRPEIQLYDDARRCLNRLAHYPIYIVTDGNKHVQLAKLQALGLYDRLPVKRCFITRRYGVHREKPSPHCFQLICKMEQVSPDQVVYIGDNPNKDFVGIKPLGFRTVRLLRGNYAQLRKPKEYEADVVLRSLDELDETVVFRSNEG